MRTRWQLQRAGLLNFWYYDDEEFNFADGKLLLRGTNGSGKSVTMQSLIPVLLDGRKSPDRLDPFGSRARKMEDYLLGEKEVSDLNERTGYLYLEYARPDSEQVMTTGIGLKAKRQSPLDFWGFVILDNRRVGRDFFLYKTERSLEGKAEKIPLTRRDLEQRLGEGGHVVRTQKEYMELVNRHLFGFKSLEAFDELIKLLIQLRSPKLSKDFRPTVIYEILNEALPSLADEELRTLSDTIENMDQIKSQLDQLVREEQSLKRLIKPYDLYNRQVRLEKAEGLIHTQQHLERVTKNMARLQEEFKAAEEEIVRLKADEEDRRREQQVLAQEKDALEQHDVFRAEKEKEQLSKKSRELDDSLREKRESLEGKKAQERKVAEAIRGAEERERQIQKAMADGLDEMESWAEEAAFLNHDVAASEFQANRHQGSFSFALWKKESKDYEAKLEEILQALKDEERAKDKYQEAELELGTARKSLDEARHQEKKWQEVQQEEREQWVASFFAWHEENELLALTAPELQLTAQRAFMYPEELASEVLREGLNKARERAKDTLKGEILSRQHDLALLKKQIKEREEEIEAWRAQKEPEPLRHKLTEQARQSLKEQGVPFLPFYAAVEFQDHVTPELRERIESALREMGILDGLIIPERCQESGNNGNNGFQVVHDRVLRPAPQIMAHTLADYLYPLTVDGNSITEAEIENILRTILVHDGPGESGESMLSVNGAYFLGNIWGHAPLAEGSVFIGKESRRQYRLREIARLQTEIASIQAQKATLETEIESWQEKLRRLDLEAERFPSEENMREAYVQLDSARRQVGVWEQEVNRKNSTVKEALEAWQAIKTRLRELARTISLEVRENVYRDACQAMRHYREGLGDLEIKYHSYQSVLAEIQLNQGRLEDLVVDVDSLQGDVNGLMSELAVALKQLELVEKRLQELGADEIRQRIGQVLQRLAAIPQEIEEFVKRTVALQKDQEQRIQSRKTLEGEQAAYSFWYKEWVKVFLDEERLQSTFVESEAPQTKIESDSSQTEVKSDSSQAEVKSNSSQVEAKSNSSQAEIEDVFKQALAVQAELAGTVSPKNRQEGSSRDGLRDRLNDVFYKEMSNLVEYRLTQQAAFELMDSWDIIEGVEENLWNGLEEELRSKARRIQLLMEYGGKRVNPYFVTRQLEQNIYLQKQLLNEKDRELYEEIIMNSVGRIIRGRIQRAEHWVAEMNRLMDERDTSSGLKFAIRWKPRTAEQEDELDTKELVDLLKADPRLLKESDMARMTAHFRAKIERAKQALDLKGYGESFHQIIKVMLDYRQWFAFSLYYQQEAGAWKELTDRAFYKFSGGEKAMAMYIPLFSAAYSRYSDARPDAPRIISLDEAFAGVDENNIRDMFDLLEKLEFNYIMNSQAIWGDYDTVTHLSIAELVRPKNAPYVSVIRYLWDGKVRRLCTADED